MWAHTARPPDRHALSSHSTTTGAATRGHGSLVRVSVVVGGVVAGETGSRHAVVSRAGAAARCPALHLRRGHVGRRLHIRRGETAWWSGLSQGGYCAGAIAAQRCTSPLRALTPLRTKQTTECPASVVSWSDVVLDPLQGPVAWRWTVSHPVVDLPAPSIPSTEPRQPSACSVGAACVAVL